MIDSISARRLLRLAISLAVCTAGAPAFSSQAEDCPLLFPDLRCERSGRYEGFVMPMAMPFLFEDPFITTGVSVWGVWHQYPDDSIFDGGEVWAIAAQARVAITDRLAFIATKDGFAMHRPELAILDDEDGFLDITAGFKYALVDMPEHGFILTPSLRFEIPVGNDQVFSGHGDGVVIPAVSAGWGLGRLHVIGALGGQVPVDRSTKSTSIFYNLHLDYRILEHLAPFAELSGQHWTASGEGTLGVQTDLGTVSLATAQALLGTGSFEGADLVSLGSTGVGGNDLLTLAVGARVPLTRGIALGVAYEFPLTRREDIFGRRVSTNVTFEF